MAGSNNSFWYDFFGLYSNNESYLIYVLSFKFVWAPIWSFCNIGFNSIKRLFNEHDSPSSQQTSVISNPLYSNFALSSNSEHPSISNAQGLLDSFNEHQFLEDDFGNTSLTLFLTERVFSETNIMKFCLYRVSFFLFN